MVSGSPPRMRGPLLANIVEATSTRITPAYAGTTPEQGYFLSRREDHPRVCGDHESIEELNTPLSGSPPRMRGPPFAFGSLVRGGGITPAYAGTTCWVD